MIGQTTIIAGRRYRYVYEARDVDYIRSDGKGVIHGIGVLGVVPIR